MLKTIDLVLIAVMISAAAYTYKHKHDAEVIETEIADVNRKIALENETISLLQADWSLLDQPDRLQRLAEAFKDDLELQPVLPQQIVSAAEIPNRPVDAIQQLQDSLGELPAVPAPLHASR